MQLTVKNSGRPWKITLALLVGAFLIAMASTLVIAARRVSAVTDADYYQHGLHYGRTASGSHNPGAGWTISASLAGAELRVLIRDQSGAPVSGGELKFVPKRPGALLSGTLMLAESTPGIFRAPRPVSPQGELHGTLRFTRGEAAASQKLVLFN